MTRPHLWIAAPVGATLITLVKLDSSESERRLALEVGAFDLPRTPKSDDASLCTGARNPIQVGRRMIRPLAKEAPDRACEIIGLAFSRAAIRDQQRLLGEFQGMPQDEQLSVLQAAIVLASHRRRQLEAERTAQNQARPHDPTNVLNSMFERSQ